MELAVLFPNFTCISMDAIRRSRFASKQMKAGPAPLASFEDLPSDELESPEDFSHSKGYICNIDDDSSRDLQFTTPDSLTISSQSTPRIESDFDSHYTLTPGDSYHGQSTSDLRTASLSSLSKDDSSTLNVQQKKGSAASLNTLETIDVEYTHRKSSWTDIFRSHNQNSAKTSVPVITQLESSEKLSKKKSKTEKSKKDPDTKSKDKVKFLSLFKKKSNKSINSPVTPDNILPTEILNISESSSDVLPDNLPTKVSNGKVPKGKENESPIDKEPSLKPFEIQNDLGKSNSDDCDKIPDERRFNRKVINITENTVEKEYNILLKQIEEKSVDKISKTDNIQDIVNDKISKTDNIQDIVNDKISKTDNIQDIVNGKISKTDNIQDIVNVKEEFESSESDLTLESKDLPVEKKEDDFEAETLLPHDLSELEEEPAIELHPVTFEISSQLLIPSRQQRLEMTTKPIDRPRSTTPINYAPLEAFIQSVSPTFDSKVDKIKLSLPGEQFLGRGKSPKKSSMKSWADFCERGLHSPRMHKRIDKDIPKNPFESSDDALSSNAQFSSTENWAAFESEFTTIESNIFGDNFKADFDFDNSTPELPKNLNDPYQYFESNFSFNSSSSDLNVFECSCSKINHYELSNAQSTNQSLSFTTCDENCSCPCHSKQKSSIKNPEPCSNIDTFGASNVFSLVTDEQF